MLGSIWIILACALWSIDTLVRYPMVERGLDPIAIVFLEHTILTFIFGLKLLPGYKSLSNLTVAQVFAFVVVGCGGSALATVAFTKSFYYLNPSLVILLQKFQPVIAILLARIILKEAFSKNFLMWAGVCLLGGYLISAPDIARFINLLQVTPSKVTSDNAIQGYTLVLISVLAWAATTVYGKVLCNQGFSQKQILGGRFTLGWIALIPFILKTPSNVLFPEGLDYLRLLVMVLISGAAAMWLYYKGMQKVSAHSAAVSEMFFPFFAIAVNWIFLGKALEPWQLVGAVLLILGAVVIQIKKY